MYTRFNLLTCFPPKVCYCLYLISAEIDECIFAHNTELFGTLSLFSQCAIKASVKINVIHEWNVSKWIAAVGSAQRSATRYKVQPGSLASLWRTGGALTPRWRFMLWLHFSPVALHSFQMRKYAITVVLWCFLFWSVQGLIKVIATLSWTSQESKQTR